MALDYRLHIRYQGRIYRFLCFELSDDRDGSFYVNFVRQGVSANRVGYNFDLKTQETKGLSETQEQVRKGVEISYHTTGLINFKNASFPRIYCEPIFNITMPFTFIIISVPAINLLDLLEEDANDKDYVWELPSDLSDRVNFTLTIAPPGCLDLKDQIATKILYWQLMELVVVVDGPIPIPGICHDHFIYSSPSKGIFDTQVIDKDTALTQFHQKKHGGQGLIIYPPNMEGVWKIIHTVPMRIPPRIDMALENSLYSAGKIENESTTTITRFIVKDQHGHKIKEAVPIKSIALDAEL